MKTKSFLRAGTLMAACALFGSMMSCTPEDKPGTGPGTDPEEPEKLENQIKLDEDLTDIKTVLYEKHGEDWTFWLSPRDGVIRIADMEEVDDYLKVTAKSPKGTIDVTKGEFTITYMDIKVSGKTMADFVKVELQADAIEYDGKVTLNLYTLVENKFGTRLTARYNGPAAAGIAEAKQNTWVLDTGEPVDIKSVVKAVKCSSDMQANQPLVVTKDYYFYNEPGKTGLPSITETAEYIRISIPSDLKGVTHDLSSEEVRSKVEIICGDLDIMASDPTGTFFVSVTEDDKTPGGSVLTMEIDAVFSKDGVTSYLRANAYIRDAASYYHDHSSTFTMVMPDGSESEQELGKIFHKKGNKIVDVFAFGLKENPSGLADLMTADKYLEVMLDHSAMTGLYPVSLPDNANSDITVYDAVKYETSKFSEVNTELFYNRGAVYAERCGDNLYLYMDVFFGNSDYKLKLNWFGPMEEVEEWIDLTPERPAAPNFIGKAPEGTDPATGSLYKKITGMTVSEATTVNGVSMEAYNFTFTCEDESSFILSFKKEDIDKGPIDLTSRKQENYIDGKVLAENFLFSLEIKDVYNSWSEPYWNFMLSGQITNTLPYMPGPTAGYIEVSGEPGGSWKISLTMKNQYMQWGMTSGDGEIVTISYEGPATE